MHRSKAKTINCLTCTYWKSKINTSKTNGGEPLVISKDSYALCFNTHSRFFKGHRFYKSKCMKHNPRYEGDKKE